jgi:hypothetical protein
VKGEGEERQMGTLRGSLGAGFTGSGEAEKRRPEKTVGVKGSEVLRAFTAVMTGFKR